MIQPVAPAIDEDFPPDADAYLTTELPRTRFIKRGQEYLADVRKWLVRNNAGLPGRHSLSRYARAHDRLIALATDHAIHHWRAEHGGPEPTWAVLALGGYGRRELYLNSDIDIMLLLEGEVAEGLIKSLMHLLIDLRLNLGYSTRTLPECIERIGTDLESTTAMTEARQICGGRGLFARFQQELRAAVTVKHRRWFMRSIFEQWEARREKYQSTVFLLEPNLKECPGGLRDVHMVQWLLYALTGSTELRQLKDLAHFDEEELKRLREAVAMVQVVRNQLHATASSKTDHMIFAHQPAVAAALGYQEDEHRSPEEVFMQDYYRNARVIARDSQRVLRVIAAENKGLIEGLVGSLRRRPIDKHLMTYGDVLFINPKYPRYLEEDPDRVMLLFESAARWGLRMSEQTLDRLTRISKSLGPGFRTNEVNQQRFVRILKSQFAGQTLKDMHACCVLDRFLPEFERISCMVRIDHYHHYTVDEHTLKAVENAERLRREGPRPSSFPGRIASQVRRYDLLYLALLLHDVGKGFGRGHALRGGQIAQRIGDRLQLAEEDTETVRWLVLSHLKLSHAAQRRDLSDPSVARQLAEEIGTLERLKLLYVHSVCDLMAVSPDAWNDWKGQLLQECYMRTAEALGETRASMESEDPGDALQRSIAQAVVDEEVLEGLTRRRNLDDLYVEVEAFLRHTSDRYLQAVPPATIARHFKMKRKLTEKQQLEWHLLPNNGLGRSELTICACDVPGLFNYICGALAAKAINIWEAQIFSTTDGFALNRFIVTDAEGKPLPAGLQLDRVRNDLNLVVRGEKTIEELIERHRSRQKKRARPRSPHPTRVLFDNESSQAYTVIEVRATDRPGLLYQITRALAECQLDIQRALIATEAYGVVDVFYVTDLEYNKIHDAAARQRIEETLLAALDGNADAPHAG